MPLAITSFTPTTASGAGGTQVTLTGTLLNTVDEFVVGGKQCQIVGTPTATTAVIRVPAQIAGTPSIFAIDNDTNTVVSSSTPLTVTSYAPPPYGTTLAAKWGFQVDSAPAKDGSGYVNVYGLTNFQPAIAQTTQDDSDYWGFDPSTGISWGSDVVTQLKFSLVATLDRKKLTGAYDPGQEVLRAAHDKGGDASVVRVRWYDRTGGPEAYEGFGIVQWSENGGATSDKSTVACTVMGRGQRQSITNPTA